MNSGDPAPNWPKIALRMDSIRERTERYDVINGALRQAFAKHRNLGERGNTCGRQ